MLLLRMRTGSHLYGTNHAGSDEDFCEVYDRLPGRRQAAQTIDGGQDTTRLGLGELMRQADKGVPQALEVMFAPPRWPDVDRIAALRASWRPGIGNVRRTYSRTIRAFAASSDPKSLRHARRLQYQLDQMLAWGSFDPRDNRWDRLSAMGALAGR